MSSIALDHITLQGFKSFVNVEKLAFGPVNILIGANGSGKSNLLDALAFLGAVRNGRLGEYLLSERSAKGLLHKGERDFQAMRLGMSFGNGIYGYTLRLDATADGGLLPSEEVFENRPPGTSTESVSLFLNSTGKSEAAISDPERVSGEAWVRDCVNEWRVYRFHDTGPESPMRAAPDLREDIALGPNGENLGLVLDWIRERHPAAYKNIVETVRRTYPDFDGLEDAASLSGGTLRFTALATLFLQPAEVRPPLILLDEPELSLHPAAIGGLASLIARAGESGQVVAATQSPLLLDYFQPEQVLMVARENGVTRFQRLEAEPLAMWLGNYSLGQIWEKNLLSVNA